MASSLIERTPSGDFAMHLADHQREVLKALAPDLRADLAMGDPNESRLLFPTVHPDDPEAEQAYQELVKDQLLESRLNALDILEEKADAEVLTEPELVAWMQAINSIRLVMGTRLNITEDDTESVWDFDPSSPETPARAAYMFLSYLLDQIVTALHSTLPDDIR